MITRSEGDLYEGDLYTGVDLSVHFPFASFPFKLTFQGETIESARNGHFKFGLIFVE